MEALYQEWLIRKPLLPKNSPLSVYFGGGTPSLLGPDNVEKILSWIQPSTCEITLEANPEDITQELMHAYCKTGINRISIGIQTLDDNLLHSLGRCHSSIQAIRAVEMAYAAGISNISIDLMYDLPRQTLVCWESTLEKALGLPITHLSLYNLTFEPHTLFYKFRSTLCKELPGEKYSLAMLKLAAKRAVEAGLHRYEISAFARPGFCSVHNSGYWEGRPFIGLGPSAHSFWNKSRFRNVASLQRYCKRVLNGDSAVDYIETLSPDAYLREKLVIGLRQLKGYFIEENTHSETWSAIEKLQTEGFLRRDNTHLSLTEKGILFYDHVAATLI